MTQFEEHWAPTQAWIDRAGVVLTEWADLKHAITSEGLLP